MKVVQAYTEGHPDKVCDQIADALVDEYLRRDPDARVDLSVMGSHGMLTIGGQVVSDADFDAGALAQRVYHEIGYQDTIEPFVNIDTKPKPIEPMIGSDGTVFVHGYATRETREYLPLPVVLANALARRIDEMRKNIPEFHWIRPDGKVQLVMSTKDGSTSGEKQKVVSVAVLLQHEEQMDRLALQQIVLDRIIVPVLGPMNEATVVVNPAGGFYEGGLGFDTGASNRKVASDTYGGLIPFGSGGLSGKDPGRMERAAAFMARFAAKTCVARGEADNVLVRLAYVLGHSEPVVIEAKTGDGRDVTTWMKQEFDFRPEAIVERLQLKKPIYRTLSNYGHFGKDGSPWEETV